MKPEDELIDALLKEQARKRDADEELLASIDKALDDEGDGKPRGVSKWRRALPLSLAAGLAIGGAVIYQRVHDDSPREAIGMGPASQEPTTTGVPDESEPFGMEPVEAPGAMKAESAPVAPPAAAAEGAAAPPAAPKAEADARVEPLSVPAPAADPLDDTIDRAVRNEASREEIKRTFRDAPPAERAEMTETLKETETAMRELAKAAPERLRLAEDSERSDKGMDARVNGSVSGGDEAGLSAGAGAPADGLAMKLELKERLVPTEESDSAVFGRRPRALSVPRPMPEPGPGIVDGDLSRENYGQLVDQPWKSPWQEALSTFSIDVDTASYTNVRRMIREGRAVQPDAVRIEELINYFDYRYPAPEGDSPFAVSSLLTTCPWQPEHLLARVAIKGREIEKNARPASNLVFLIDVSGSMQSPDKLPMLKRAMETLVGSLDERDRVGIVVYAGTEGVVLSPTELTEEGKSKALRAIGKLESGGSTNGGAGLSRAYQMALKHMVDGGVNRVILATDGDFNVGTTGQGQLVELVKGNAGKGVSLSVLGFGTGNLNDSMLEAITNDGNGNYFYVDGDREAERVFQQKLTGTLVTIAKDVKIQVEFNPGKVKAYRLIGYANRVLRNQDFNDDKVDAGDIGAGLTVTAFYEIVPVGVAAPEVGDVDGLKYQRPADRRELVESNDWYTLKLRYKHPEGEKSRLIETPVTAEPVKWQKAGKDFRMASAVALFGMKLRGMEEVADIGWKRVEALAKPALADDLDERRAEFLELVKELE